MPHFGGEKDDGREGTFTRSFLARKLRDFILQFPGVAVLVL